MLPIGIGGNVHSELIPNALVPEMGWKRFDMAGFRGNCKNVEKFYAPQLVVWLCQNTDDILKLVSDGIVGACVEGPNEPNLSFPASTWANARPAYSPEDYITVLRGMFELCLRHGYSLMGVGSSNWTPKQGLAWTKAVIDLGVLYYCHAVATHPYGATSASDIKSYVNLYGGLTFGKPIRPHIFTEFGHPDPNVLAAVTKQSLALKVPICLYDLCDTGDLALLDLPTSWDDPYTYATPSDLLKGFRKAMIPNEVN